MTREKFITLFPHASASCLRENALLWNWPPESTPAPKRRTLAKILTDTYVRPAQPNGTPQNSSPAQSAVVEQTLLDVPVQPSHGKAAYSGRVAIRVKSFRCRLIDPDNLCPKYFIDGLRYAGIISGDSAAEVEILTTQTRVSSKEEERTEIEITPL